MYLWLSKTKQLLSLTKQLLTYLNELSVKTASSVLQC